MRTFDIRSFVSRLPSLGFATAQETLYMNYPDEKGHQIRAFSQDREYKVTRVNKDHLILVDNTGLEHFVLKGKWMNKFKVTLQMKTGKYNGTLVYVVFVARDISYALISYNQDQTGAFKVDLNELADLNFVPQKKSEEEGPE